jgi:hypothetical protein
MKKLRIAVTDYYPWVKALSLDNGDGEAFFHLVIVDTGNGCSIYMRDEVSDEIAEFLREEKIMGSEFPRLDFLEATSHDILDQLKRKYSLLANFPRVEEIQYLMD